MNSEWYCTDCESTIEAEEIATHEEQGHQVRGKIRPERLLENDPWENTGEATDGGGE